MPASSSPNRFDHRILHDHHPLCRPCCARRVWSLTATLQGANDESASVRRLFIVPDTLITPWPASISPTHTPPFTANRFHGSTRFARFQMQEPVASLTHFSLKCLLTPQVASAMYYNRGLAPAVSTQVRSVPLQLAVSLHSQSFGAATSNPANPTPPTM